MSKFSNTHCSCNEGKSATGQCQDKSFSSEEAKLLGRRKKRDISGCRCGSFRLFYGFSELATSRTVDSWILKYNLVTLFENPQTLSQLQLQLQMIFSFDSNIVHHFPKYLSQGRNCQSNHKTKPFGLSRRSLCMCSNIPSSQEILEGMVLQ